MSLAPCCALVGELGQLKHRWHDVDPDAVDMAAYRADCDRWQLLEEVLAQPERTEQYEELKTKAARQEDRWNETWQQYQQVLHEEWRIQNSREMAVSMGGGFDGRHELVHGLTQRRRRFEAAQGA